VGMASTQVPGIQSLGSPGRPRAAATADRASTGSDLEDLLREDEWLLEPQAIGTGEGLGVEGASPAPMSTSAPKSQPSGAEPIVGVDTPMARIAPAALTASTKAPSAGSQAGLLGLSGLPIRCPEALRVELAVDASGGLHAIVLDEISVESGMAGGPVPTHGPAPASGTGRAGVAALLAADAWARTNMDLLSRAMPFVRAGDVTLHLLTRVPAAARDLLGTRVRVHLLARASGPGDVCVGLN